MNRGTYSVFDRLFYLMSLGGGKLNLKSYMNKFEISRSSAMRDVEHLKLFYDYDFIYDRFTKLYTVEKLK